jgi:hypothetical protein
MTTKRDSKLSAGREAFLIVRADTRTKVDERR